MNEYVGRELTTRDMRIRCKKRVFVSVECEMPDDPYEGAPGTVGLSPMGNGDIRVRAPSPN